MDDLVLGACVAVAIVAAVRSTWSPCGQSMLSSITPMSERARNQHWGVTATWFVIGAVAGGATLGALTALLAAGVAALDPTTLTLAAIGAGCALVAASLDLGAFGLAPPYLRRQVNEIWLGTYRGWLYGVGFGWQIGVGITTYVMTAAVFLTIALAALTTDPLVAFAIATLFGLIRGLGVLLARKIDSPAQLASFHRRFHDLGPSTRAAAIVVQLVVAVVLAWSAAGAAVGLALIVVIGLVAVIGRGAGHRDAPSGDRELRQRAEVG
ncbi:MAG: hypothetical protein MUP97_12000 [Acidimicrobiia bacterium]|nr:hypothetical protein [Acidimicrobiia bacterium]